MTSVAWEVPIGGEVFVGFFSFKSEAFPSFVHGKGHLMDYISNLLCFGSAARGKTSICAYEVRQHAFREKVKLDTRVLSRTILGFYTRFLTSAPSIHLVSSNRKSDPFP